MNFKNYNMIESDNILTTPMPNVITQVETKELLYKGQKKAKNHIFYNFLKRCIDIIGSCFGMMLLVPMIGIIYIANRICKDNGPLFFTQERIGKNGKTFKMYKFRSMVVGAEEKLEKYLAENEDAKYEFEINRKLKNDPRITKVGNFIRRTSIDEFPQFINVFKGDMSLVGPRPYIPEEKLEMGVTYYKNIIEHKPGITGYWQVNGRSDVTFQDRLDMDMKYHNHCNLGIDAKILLKTVETVVKKEGAS